MKVGLVYTSFLPTVGGIEIVMLNIGTELVRRGHSVTVLTVNAVDSKRAALRLIEDIEGIHVKRFDIPPFPCSVLSIPKLVSHLISMDFDVTHVFSYHFTLFTNVASLIQILTKRSLVATPIYNPIRATLHRTFFSKCTGLFFDKKLGMEILKRASFVTALSESEAVFYKQNGVSNVRTIPEGVDILRPSNEDVVRFKKEHHLDSEVVLSVGRIEEYKRHDLLIKAFCIVLKEFPKAKLLIVGKDWGYLSTLKKIIDECECNKSVIFTGLVSDAEVKCAYESANVVVHTSRFETFARIALEAWSHGKPIICFDLGGPTEFITPKMGILVKYGDTETLGKMIIKLLLNKELSKAMGENGYHIVESKHLWSKIVDEYEYVYRIVLDRAN